MTIEPHSYYQILHNPPRVIITPDPAPTPNHDAVFTALYRYMQSSNGLPESDEDDELAIPIDGVYASTDEFRIYEFKIRACTRARAHDWTECPFAHPGEKARRRDPRRYPYSGTACTDFRKGGCVRGDACEFAHGVFECWLHPARYRTQACKDGPACTRRVCFFAHSPDQLRVLSGLPSPRSIASARDPFEEPATINELVASLRSLQLNRMGLGSPRFGPVTPTRYWEEEEPLPVVESGRELRAKMFEKMSKDNPLTIPDVAEPDPDVGWVTDLVR